MAESSEQAKPLASSVIFRSRSDEEEAITISSSKSRQRSCVKIFGCITAFLLILAVVILVLFFTVFHIKTPEIKMNKITLLPLNLLNNGSLKTDANITYLADVSVKNPNFGSFKFNNCTTTVFQGSKVIAEAVAPSGVAKARRTIHLNVTVDLIPQKTMENSVRFSMNSSTVIGGKVKILEVVKKYLMVEVNCSITISYNFTSQRIQQNCTRLSI